MLTILKYFLVSIVLYFIIMFLTINLANIFGDGYYGSGDIISGIAILSTVLIICTYIIVKAINKKH